MLNGGVGGDDGGVVMRVHTKPKRNELRINGTLLVASYCTPPPTPKNFLFVTLLSAWRQPIEHDANDRRHASDDGDNGAESGDGNGCRVNGGA